MNNIKGTNRLSHSSNIFPSTSVTIITLPTSHITHDARLDQLKLRRQLVPDSLLGFHPLVTKYEWCGTRRPCQQGGEHNPYITALTYDLTRDSLIYCPCDSFPASTPATSVLLPCSVDLARSILKTFIPKLGFLTSSE